MTATLVSKPTIDAIVTYARHKNLELPWPRIDTSNPARTYHVYVVAVCCDMPPIATRDLDATLIGATLWHENNEALTIPFGEDAPALPAYTWQALAEAYVTLTEARPLAPVDIARLCDSLAYECEERIETWDQTWACRVLRIIREHALTDNDACRAAPWKLYPAPDADQESPTTHGDKAGVR